MESIWLVIYRSNTNGLGECTDSDILGWFSSEQECWTNWQNLVDDDQADMVTEGAIRRSDVDQTELGIDDDYCMPDDWHTRFPEYFVKGCIGPVEDHNGLIDFCICFQQVKCGL